MKKNYLEVHYYPFYFLINFSPKFKVVLRPNYS